MSHDIKSLVKKINQKAGSYYASLEAFETDRVRLPSGIFPLDFACGGGIPIGCMSIVYGPESSGKTNLALQYIRMAQKLWPTERVAFVDAEHSLDPKWAAQFGVNVKRLVHFKPAWGEDAVDWTEAALAATDVCMVVLDSIAAITPSNTIEKEAGRVDVAGNSQLVGKLIQKTTYSMAEAQASGRDVTFLALNQVRYKIGMMFGDPETIPGGKRMFHASQLTLRLYGKNEMDEAVHPSLPAVKATNVSLKKWKVPILNPEAEYKMAMIPHNGLGCGEVNDWNTVRHYLSELKWLKKKGTKYLLLDQEFPTVTAIRKHCMQGDDFGKNLRVEIIGAMIEKVGIAPKE